jgi:hypothetical protein
MTNRNKKSRITVVGSLHRMVCTRKRASHLLQGLRKDYQLLTPEERNQVECFLLGFYPTSSSWQRIVANAATEYENKARKFGTQIPI